MDSAWLRNSGSDRLTDFEVAVGWGLTFIDLEPNCCFQLNRGTKSVFVMFRDYSNGRAQLSFAFKNCPPSGQVACKTPPERLCTSHDPRALFSVIRTRGFKAWRSKRAKWVYLALRQREESYLRIIFAVDLRRPNSCPPSIIFRLYLRQMAQSPCRKWSCAVLTNLYSSTESCVWD